MNFTELFFLNQNKLLDVSIRATPKQPTTIPISEIVIVEGTSTFNFVLEEFIEVGHVPLKWDRVHFSYTHLTYDKWHTHAIIQIFVTVCDVKKTTVIRYIFLGTDTY